MKFGVREICDVVLRAKANMTLGSRKFYAGEPVLYFDTLKTSSIEGQATTVYAQGGRGNARLVAWEGERTVTFTFEDALISPESFAILSGAGLIDAKDANSEKGMFVHTTSRAVVKKENTIVIKGDYACWTKVGTNDSVVELNGLTADDLVNNEAGIFVMTTNDKGEIDDEPCIPVSVKYFTAQDENGNDIPATEITCYSRDGVLKAEKVVIVDYYVKRKSNATQIEITADKFGGNYYLEASTLFRRESDGVDMPAEFIIPNGKIQSNFTFSMASSNDPSTFTFTMDAFPDYTKFDKTHKVLAAIQVIDDNSDTDTSTREACEEHVDKHNGNFPSA